MRNSRAGFKNKLDAVKDKTVNQKPCQYNVSEMKDRERKKEANVERSLRDTLGIVKRSNLHYFGVPEAKREKVREKQ